MTIGWVAISLGIIVAVASVFVVRAAFVNRTVPRSDADPIAHRHSNTLRLSGTSWLLTALITVVFVTVAGVGIAVPSDLNFFYDGSEMRRVPTPPRARARPALRRNLLGPMNQSCRMYWD